MKKLSPAQQQYADLKQAHQDCLLFFRLGDFYEVFHEDAKLAHKVLGITLTARNKQSENPIPMAGIPHHSLEKYVPQLIEAGIKIAIAEQVWLPSAGKIVERKVTQVITPGTYVSESSHQQRILAITEQGNHFHCAWGDFTLWEYTTKTCATTKELIWLIHSISPVELIIDADLNNKQIITDQVVSFDMVVTQLGVPYDIEQFLKSQLWVSSLSGYGQALEWWRAAASALLFNYFVSIQKRDVWAVHSLSFANTNQTVHLDAITIKNLEIFASSYEWSKTHSLYGILDTCATAMGSRLMATYLREPLMDVALIRQRASRIQRYHEDTQLAEQLQRVMKSLIDLPRLLTSIMYKKPSALKVQNLSLVLNAVLSDKTVSEELTQRAWLELEKLDKIVWLSWYLNEWISDDAIMEQKNFIKHWADEEVDRLRHIAFSSDELLLEYQQDLVQESGVANIKVKFVKNQWYSIEVTPKDIVQFETIINPDQEKLDFVRTQSLKGGQRYVSTFLWSLQQKILESSELLIIREQELLLDIVQKIQWENEGLFLLSDALAIIDLSSSHALFSRRQERCLPVINTQWFLKITEWKHPVVQKFLDSKEQFIPNDLIQKNDDFFHLITGPNMWGKSTFLRQHALIVLLAHAGFMVPAASAEISIVDGIFARVWSWDVIAKNQSTFMTEMIEVSNILHHATQDSFIVLDELGRGTSTYDGLALAKAITVYICQNIKAKSLFATHYHELTWLEWEIPWFSNRHARVLESEDEVVFMKKIIKWWASKSYGIDVAKLAGVPDDVLKLANKYLAALEESPSSVDKAWSSQVPTSLIQQTSFFWVSNASHEMNPSDVVKKKNYEWILNKIEKININDTTPLDLMKKIDELQQEISDL